MRLCLPLLVTVAFGPRAVAAQTATLPRPLTAQPVFALGQPPVWLPYIGALALTGDQAGAGALVGVGHPLLNPISGLLGASAEMLVGRQAGDFKLDARALATVPALGLGFGADWQVSRADLDFVVAFQTAIRRGGLIGGGSTLRADWIAGHHGGFDLGLQMPLFQPFAGRTRPHDVGVSPPRTSSARRIETATLPAPTATALAAVDRGARAIAAYGAVYSAADQATIDSTPVPAGEGGYDEMVRAYDGALVAAFAGALNDTTGAAAIGTRARSQILNDVILPYDGLFGQLKTDASWNAMIDAARRHFADWMRDSSRVPGDAQRRANGVFAAWSASLGRVARTIGDRWNDSRLVWLPPQLALSPEEYDEQDEVDSLVGRAVGHSFAGNNTLAYLRTADLPVEIARSIMAARRYHVLWTHDFTGRRPAGELDQIAYTMAADAYLPALTAAVERYDSTGVMPQYLILFDAFYYHARDGRLWMDLLENPLGAKVALKSSETREAAHIAERLTALRAAVARSKRLAREAAQQGGDAWLRRVVRVHVNILLPSDFSFRSASTMPPVPFTSDNVMREHRKLVIYDLTEADPYAGELLATGVGVGEHYASATWEDRGLRLRGPGALEARYALRRALESNGFRPDQIPEPLRLTAREKADSAGAAHTDGVANVLQVHNEPGFGAKQASVARAMLYSLAPAGSVIVAPDPLWVSESWAAMLFGAALRGCHVVIIAPALANAPSPETPIIVLERDMLQQMLARREHLAARLLAAGGELRLGLYASHAPVSDVAGRLAEVRAGLARDPWIRGLIPFDDSTLAALNQASGQAGQRDATSILAQDETPREPQLHQKTVLIARPGAIAALVRQPGWASVLTRTMRAQSMETAKLAEAIAAPEPSPDTAAVRASDELMRGYERGIGESDRKRLSFYFMVGSQNHDPRGLLLDGETSVVVSGFSGSVGLVDLFYLMARTTWIDTAADVDRLVPPPRGLIARLAHFVRLVM